MADVNVLLYSGGLDSHIAYHILTRSGQEWKRIYFNLSSRYSTKEYRDLYERKELDFLMTGLRVSDMEQPDGFVPQRNLLLVTYAQGYHNADHVALAAVRGEGSRDKHREFFIQSSKLLSYTAGKPVRVFSPLLNLTKSEAVKYYLAIGGDPDSLLGTISCYSAEQRACGECMSCFRRWVALENNGLTQEWDKTPWTWDGWRKFDAALAHKLPGDLHEVKAFASAQLDIAKAFYKLGRRLGV